MSHHTPQVGRKPGAPAATAVTPAPASAPAEKKVLSNKVLGMKFMQRHNETALRKSLEAEKHQARNEEQWTTPVRAAPAAAAAVTALSASPVAAAASSFSPFHAASASASAAASASFPYAAAFSLPLRAPPPRGMFVDQSDTSDTPALPASAADTPASVAAAAPSDAPLPPFVPGRRSYGSFNPKIEALVSEAQAACSASGKESKLAARAVRNSVSDDQMADNYVGLRGKAASGGRGGGGGGGAGGAGKQGFPRNDQSNKKKKQQAPGGGGQQQQHRKHARTDGEGAAHPQKKQKKPGQGGAR